MSASQDNPWTQYIRRALEDLGTGRSRVVVPEPVGLHRPRVGAGIHAFPELFLQTGGGTDFECPTGTFRLKTNELCLMPTAVPHGETPVDLRTKYEIVVLMRDGADGIAVRARANATRKIRAQEWCSIPGAGRAFRILEQASEAFLVHPDFQADYIRPLIQSFLTCILSGLLHPPEATQPAVPHLVSEAEKWIRVHLSTPDLTVAMVARELNCSSDHLSRLFRSARACTLNVWITRERVQLACDLLERSQQNVSEITWACGFRHPSYFIRVFRAHTGMTPRAWREQLEPRAGSAG